jgi:hypothetical protein
METNLGEEKVQLNRVASVGITVAVEESTIQNQRILLGNILFCKASVGSEPFR